MVISSLLMTVLIQFSLSSQLSPFFTRDFRERERKKETERKRETKKKRENPVTSSSHLDSSSATTHLSSMVNHFFHPPRGRIFSSILSKREKEKKKEKRGGKKEERKRRKSSSSSFLETTFALNPLSSCQRHVFPILITYSPPSFLPFSLTLLSFPLSLFSLILSPVLVLSSIENLSHTHLIPLLSGANCPSIFSLPLYFFSSSLTHSHTLVQGEKEERKRDNQIQTTDYVMCCRQTRC